MKHKSHLKQKNKHFKKCKSKKKKKSINNIQKKKKKDISEKYSHILYRKHQSHNTKTDNIKNEREEKSKYIPFYDSLNICIVGFHEEADVLSFKREFIKYLYEKNEHNILEEDVKLYNVYTIHSDKKKKKRSLVIYDVPRDIYGIIDGTKCADLILCIFKDASIQNSAFDELGYELLSILKTQGVPSVIGIGYNTSECNKNSQRYVMRYFNSEFTLDDKIFFINRNNKDYDFLKLYNEIMSMKIKKVSYREGRGYMIVDSYSYNSENDSIYLKGFVKGVGFNVYNPIHITNIGDYYIDNIYVIDVLTQRKNNENVNAKNSFLLNQNDEQKNRNNFLDKFLIDNKDMNQNINYNYILVQDSKKNNNFNDEEDDFRCIRPYNIEENNLLVKNLMTLQNKHMSESFPSKNFGYTNDNADNNNHIVYKYNINGGLNSINNNTNNIYNNVNNITNMSNINNINVNNICNNINNTSNNVSNMYNNGITSNTWTYISNEKREVNEDIICSYDKNDTINENKNNFCSFIDNEESSSNSILSEENSSYGDNEDIKTEGEIDDDCIERDSENYDNVYLSKNISARERFKKYRSLQSFRTSYIDVYEDLPIEYSRIYDYESFENLIKYSKRKYLENCKIINNEFTLTDAYCLFIIKNDGKLINLINYKTKKLPLVISSLLPFERKVTVVNMEITRTPFYAQKVESKEVFEIVCGFRHFMSCPIFSEQLIKGTQSKAKYEKYLKSGNKYVASIYGFTTVTASPVFIIKKNIQSKYNNLIDNEMSVKENFSQNYNNCEMTKFDISNDLYNKKNTFLNDISSSTIDLIKSNVSNDYNSGSILIAHGKVMNCDCKRIIMKRICLCGKIFKIHKKKAVIRNMFYSPKDINYFKPVELHTKFGLTGKILESLGTHGKMKCLFNNVLKQHDKVFIFLYKRVYPVWFPLTWGGDQNIGPDDKLLQKKRRI
ncbi:ribosome biogenesis protein TSR1, putative [Plasmodium gallinaceum]|uniref:Ribosome biogenesis protein TSR1, putative n=1 Tax=Plasmodium gallinaceum TaxID=5849 RepID=A0A1J1GQZ6_PLAGA|nr:ribosome biogenesis protein TSR1, putative [Plasmodium gallinaceum]CRG94714.1 ribosome biogenesis protein TSR1, putative [Plasmodium gallinaceum]